ncbi:SDR family NAD(P)-dependent oxidoreductase [Clostridium sp. Marseille-Q2269]|uniref:SDR family NAD(P)-dependent oxidoreductase n=1 Tax=Clostridium sp. Marseille-Q2269 TaxID=2942205 RepID=UPI0020730023|nr:SDR family NAD(P)-dependent oxidoreductase [Clostridium sp. Marseille-Q2269]
MSKILITGAGSGLGKAASIALAKRGHKVYATTHTKPEADDLKEIGLRENISKNIESFKLDITLKADRDIAKDLDVDALINNAAIGDSGSASEVPVDKYRTVFETNVFSPLELTQIVFKNMVKKSEGRIIFLSSLSGRITMPFLSPYTSSKFALEAIVSSLKEEVKELDNSNIDIILIEPGAYKTGFNQKNIDKQFVWMMEKSYFKDKSSKLKNKQYNYFELTEEKSFDSIIAQYINAIEDKKPKFRYKAPLIQSAFTQGQRILGK